MSSPPAAGARPVDITTAVYDEARRSRLGADKFMIDGRHTGTGGGNHVVVGGATAPDSPFLRRPDVLKSLLLYWQRHPSLSYLFSGLFVGPTSQAPRIDEARARRASTSWRSPWPPSGAGGREGRQAAGPGWSTACCATCWPTSAATRTAPRSASTSSISPDGPTGRLGLVEFRGFEMPPDARMRPGPAAADPRADRLVLARAAGRRAGALGHERCTTASCCRTSSGRISSGVLGDLRGAGYRFRSGLVRGAARVPLPRPRQGRAGRGQRRVPPCPGALACHGREGSAGGTVRFVDASVERLQVLANGFNRGGTSSPSAATPVPWPRLAWPARRWRGCATRPGHRHGCLHPTRCAARAVDLRYPRSLEQAFAGWSGLSCGPSGGRRYDTFPVNSYEAQGRRAARFQDHGYTPGRVAMPVRDALPRVSIDARPAEAFAAGSPPCALTPPTRPRPACADAWLARLSAVARRARRTGPAAALQAGGLAAVPRRTGASSRKGVRGAASPWLRVASATPRVAPHLRRRQRAAPGRSAPLPLILGEAGWAQIAAGVDPARDPARGGARKTSMAAAS